MTVQAISLDRPVGDGAAPNVIRGPWGRTPAAEAPAWPGSLPGRRTATCAKGQQVFIHGDVAERYYEVVDGAVSAYVQLLDGRRQIIDFFFPGDIFGFSPSGRYFYTAEAITQLAVRSHPVALKASLADTDGAEMRALFASTVDSLHGAHSRMLMLGRMRADERVASFLLLMADRIGSGVDGAIELPMTRLDIADYLGLTIETVSRTFSELKRDGLIALPSSKRFVLLRADDLRELAGEEEIL
jgi:CRP-like cAMP-binding protein